MNEALKMLEKIKQGLLEGEYDKAPQFIEPDFNALKDKLEEVKDMIKCHINE